MILLIHEASPLEINNEKEVNERPGTQIVCAGNSVRKSMEKRNFLAKITLEGFEKIIK
ncbi:MAG: hypothetical protein QXM43_01655 [Desulfurococcaceae archaeon]